MTDTSTPYDRVAFMLCIEGGQGPIATYAANLMNCQLPIADDYAFMLHLPTSGPGGVPFQTFAQAATAVLARIAAGRPPT